MTQSEYGFIGGDPPLAERAKPYLRSPRRHQHRLDGRLRAYYARACRERHGVPQPRDALRRRDDLRRAADIANDAPPSPQGGRHPEGPPPLQAFLGLPFRSPTASSWGWWRSPTGPDGYEPELIELLQPLLTTCCIIILGSAQRGKAAAADRGAPGEERGGSCRAAGVTGGADASRQRASCSRPWRSRSGRRSCSRPSGSPRSGRSSASIAHEINNPLGYVASNLATLEEYLRRPSPSCCELYREVDGDPGPSVTRSPRPRCSRGSGAVREQERLGDTSWVWT